MSTSSSALQSKHGSIGTGSIDVAASPLLRPRCAATATAAACSAKLIACAVSGSSHIRQWLAGTLAAGTVVAVGLIQVASKKPVRANSVSNRLFKQKQAESEDDAEDDGVQIKRQLEKLDNELVQNGGINCGWDAPDHKDFLRIRTKHNNKTTTVGFMQELMRAVPNVDHEAI